MTKWISIKNRHPKHKEIVFTRTEDKNNIRLLMFVNTKKMNRDLWKHGLPTLFIDSKKTPYFFYKSTENLHKNEIEIITDIMYWVFISDFKEE